MGKSLRDKCPRRSHAAWKAPDGRLDPVLVVERSDSGRIPELVPIRHGRMLPTPFTFYRGAALNMAADLAVTPATGLRVQACGDCHLLNFGAFGTPERRMIFDINDLDETLPAPWEWDVKRLAASFVLACRSNQFRRSDTRDAVLSCVRSYRERMAEFARMSVLEAWYSSLDVDKLMPLVRRADQVGYQRLRKRRAGAASGSHEHGFPVREAGADGAPVIKDNPPLIYHPVAKGGEDLLARARGAFEGYRHSLPDDRKVLLGRYEVKDLALKVVGVGSVGTLCSVVLLMAGERDCLVLQVKEARRSVLEAYAGRSVYPNHAQRVVAGYHLMQPASDIFLGWTKDNAGRHAYVRQLKDMKLAPLVDQFSPRLMVLYAELCGWALARAHARSGDPAQISGYLGASDRFDKAIAGFAHAYADQAERDHALLQRAVRSGRLKAEVEG